MTDASDLGILASDVVIVVDLEDVDSFDGVADGPAAEEVLYCVDLRPTTCGMAVPGTVLSRVRPFPVVAGLTARTGFTLWL